LAGKRSLKLSKGKEYCLYAYAFLDLIIAYFVNNSLYKGNDLLPTETEWKQFDQTDDYHKALVEPDS
jgi:hypothetical protein